VAYKLTHAHIVHIHMHTYIQYTNINTNMHTSIHTYIPESVCKTRLNTHCNLCMHTYDTYKHKNMRTDMHT